MSQGACDTALTFADGKWAQKRNSGYTTVHVLANMANHTVITKGNLPKFHQMSQKSSLKLNGED